MRTGFVERYGNLWISADATNAQAVFRALREFGVPLADLTAADFAQEGYFYQMGVPPVRVDILMGIPGVAFDEPILVRSSRACGLIRWASASPMRRRPWRLQDLVQDHERPRPRDVGDYGAFVDRSWQQRRELARASSRL